jgi:c-di-GMP-binding flagellar brake protein YcgR
VFEKRKYTRIAYREAVEYHVLPGPAAPAVQSPPVGGSLSWDLSEGGIRFRAPEFIALNTELALRFILDNENPVSLTAKVVWVQQVPHAEQYHLGLEFKKTPENMSGQRLLRNFILKVVPPENDF